MSPTTRQACERRGDSLARDIGLVGDAPSGGMLVMSLQVAGAQPMPEEGNRRDQWLRRLSSGGVATFVDDTGERGSLAFLAHAQSGIAMAGAPGPGNPVAHGIAERVGRYCEERISIIEHQQFGRERGAERGGRGGRGFSGPGVGTGPYG